MIEPSVLSFAAALPLLSTAAFAVQDGQGEPAPVVVELDEKEAAFDKLLRNAVLAGHFTIDGRALEGPLEEDRYTILSVEKLDGASWRVNARIAFGQVEVTLPVPVKVHFAGDTPVLSVTELTLPGVGTYDARVLFHKQQYAGTWHGKGYGGKLFGRVEPLDLPPVPATPPGEDQGDGGDAGGGDEEGSGDEAAAASSPGGDDDPQAFWPRFRGPSASGIAEGFALPLEWNGETGAGIAWKTEIPGLSHASPVVHGDSIYLVSAVKEGQPAELKVGLYGSIGSVADEGAHQLQVLRVRRSDGEILWTRTAWEGVPAVKRHPKGSHAASTPATDGEHVVAFFGSEGLYCYDAQGELLWSKDFGVLDSGFYMMPGAQWGFGSSPVIHGDKLLVQVDVQEDSWIGALDLASGEELWRTPRDEVPTWSTPTVDRRPGRAQVIVNGYKHIGGYDLDTGAELWKLRGGGDIPVPTPVVGEGLVFITNAHGRMAPIYAIRPDVEGEIEMGDEAAMAWSSRNRGNYMQTPLVYRGLLYCCSDAGVLACYDARTGEEHYRERLGGGGSGFTASPVAGHDLLYFTSEVGDVHVVAAGPEYELAAVNPLGEECMATPAIAEGQLLFRGRRHLICVGE